MFYVLLFSYYWERTSHQFITLTLVLWPTTSRNAFSASSSSQVVWRGKSTVSLVFHARYTVVIPQHPATSTTPDGSSGHSTTWSPASSQPWPGYSTDGSSGYSTTWSPASSQPWPGYSTDGSSGDSNTWSSPPPQPGTTHNPTPAPQTECIDGSWSF